MKPKNILGSLVKMQGQMAAIQKEAEAAEFTGVAQKGLVKIIMAGTGELKRVVIDPTVLEEDADTVEALVLVASADAYKQKEAFAKERLAKVAGGLMPMGIKDTPITRMIVPVTTGGKKRIILEKSGARKKPINEAMIKTLMMQMGRKPNQKQINQMMKAMQKYQ